MTEGQLFRVQLVGMILGLVVGFSFISCVHLGLVTLPAIEARLTALEAVVHPVNKGGVK
jgi:hypothetical protein